MWRFINLDVSLLLVCRGSLPHHLGDVRLDQPHHGGVGLHINENRRRWIIKANN
jgi:hypothetical protein